MHGTCPLYRKRLIQHLVYIHGISLFVFIYTNLLSNSVNHNDSIPLDKNGVFSTINFAINELSNFVCIDSIGTSAIKYNTTNIIKYTSKNPKIDPSNLLIGRNNGILATKSNIEAMICKTIFVMKKIITNAIPL